jgi:hypothetical protein
MDDPRNGHPAATVLVILTVGLAAGFAFVQLNHETRRPEASGMAGVGADAIVNKANRR